MQAQSTYAREMHAITEAVAKFRHYLLGHHFVIRTNHKSLKEMQTQAIQMPEQQAWLLKLLGFDFTIEYRKEPTTKELTHYPESLWHFPKSNMIYILN